MNQANDLETAASRASSGRGFSRASAAGHPFIGNAARSRFPLFLGALLLGTLLLCAGPAVEGQSLWMRSQPGSGPRSLYEADFVPEAQYKINDLILVLVEESGSASNNANTNLRRKFDLNAEVKDFATFDPEELTLRAAGPELLPSVDIKSERKLEARGTTDRKERITFKISARVVDIRPNGNLLIEGRTTRLVNDEESLLTIFGEISPLDILPRIRTIRSERIADLKLIYSGSGPVSRNGGRTWLTIILDWLWPF